MFSQSVQNPRPTIILQFTVSYVDIVLVSSRKVTQFRHLNTVICLNHPTLHELMIAFYKVHNISRISYTFLLFKKSDYFILDLNKPL